MAEINTLLIANRGEIARRIIRTCRTMGIDTVAVFSDPDEAMPFVAEADVAVRLPGAAAADTYLRGDLIVEAALRTGADAVHPGYGFLSENAGFARACAEAGLTFVGPTPPVIELMGDKLAAKQVMDEAGVPVLRGIDVTRCGADDQGAAAGRVGWPVMVKASFGGGGRGLRIVRREEDLADAVASAQREAEAAFGDGTVFLERYVDRPRHIEVQIVGDVHGTVTHLFERECSIQRRHQKIIEESPSPAVDDDLRERMVKASITAGQTVGYSGVGTIEYLLAPSGEFFFLEMNTRLQVEHPVTEAVTGLDVVALQLQVAEGQPLRRDVLDATMNGHAIEARLYAEDPSAGFRPASGTLHRFDVPGGAVRVDSGVEAGSVVGPHYDPMLAKVIAWAPTRRQAARTLAQALAAARIHGLETNRQLLVGVLSHPEFAAGEIDTHFLERHEPGDLAGERGGVEARRWLAAAAALAGQAERRASATVAGLAPSGWRNNPAEPQRVTFDDRGTRIDVAYSVCRDGVDVTVDDVVLEDIHVVGASADLVVLETSGLRRRYEVSHVGDRVQVEGPRGSSCVFLVGPRFPVPETRAEVGSQLAPMPGTVVRVAAGPGEAVVAGQLLLVIEAMKMEHPVNSTTSGTVAEVLVAVGAQVHTGDVLVRMEGQT